MAGNVQVYTCDPGFTVTQVGDAVAQFLENEKGMVTQTFSASNGYIIQAKTEGSMKQLTGMGKAIQVAVRGGSGRIEAEIGSAKWSDKAGAGAIGMMVFFPLAITAGIGAVGQSQLPKEIHAYIERYLLMAIPEAPQGASFPAPVAAPVPTPVQASPSPQPATSFCVSCGQPLAAGVRFCSSCGAEQVAPQPQKNTCPSCGTELQPTQRYCHQCGTDTQA